jgi:hypothetical protein
MDLSTHIHPTCSDAMPDLNAVRNGDQTQLIDADLIGAQLKEAVLPDGFERGDDT